VRLLRTPPFIRDILFSIAIRRGAYRVIYRIDEAAHVVHVVRIDHRADVYRTM
jgi:mRNA interferase RelE/StbE